MTLSLRLTVLVLAAVPLLSAPARAARAQEMARMQRAAPAASGEDAAKPAADTFSNGCDLPLERAVRVPKTKEALLTQTGAGFGVVRRDMFLFASDLPEKEFDRLVNGVFACGRYCLARDFFDIPPRKVVTVYVFRDMESYRRGLRDFFAMKPISPYGHYGHSQRYIVVNYATGPGTLVHELTHALMADDFPSAPIWISEGMASLYEQCRVEKDSLRGDPNWRLPELKRALKSDSVTPLADLFGYSASEFRYSKESLHYAESRYFCMFLEERGLLRPLYHLYRDTVSADPTGRKAVERAFGQPLEEVEKAWRLWLATQEWTPPKR